MRYLAIAILLLGFMLGIFWPLFGSGQPAQYLVYTASQPRCSAAEAGDLTTVRGDASGPFRAACTRSDGQWFWDALPDPATPIQPVCGPASNAETAYCPNTDWRNWQ